MGTETTFEKLTQASMLEFSLYGYNGASISKIAHAAGIQKSSLYSHFKSKDALFMHAYRCALDEELINVQNAFSDTQINRNAPGFSYCENLVERYDNTPILKFFLQTSYLSPLHLADEINELHSDYIQRLTSEFKNTITTYTALKFDTDFYTEVYISIIDSIQIKLVYTNKELTKLRLDALMTLLKHLIGENNVSFK
ncbi:TetR/AcrR family transcriptional regulator [Proteus sp. CD3]|uniref:TetR/AcrR family transcriptional regulator n=1 Tax=Proteus sp. CD3 TaxID=1921565 RepID=UPI001249C491|nr:TetR/AcrR family transcriptional regulator [Proteus sp. CD3]QEZ92162.1 hypothetical protein BTA34_07275 [Proteus sp. CD3]